METFHYSSFTDCITLTLAIGIRSGNAFIICALAIYQYYNHRTNYFLSLFIIFCTIFLHHAALIILAIWLLFPLFRKRPLIGAIAIVAVLFTYTNYESYISFFMGGGSIFESMGSDLQQSIATYTGSKLNSFHNTVTVAIQTMLVTLLFIRGGGLKQVSLLRHRDENGILSGSINEFQIVLLITTYSLIALLSFNGNRYFVIALVLSFLPIMDQFVENPFMRMKRYLLIDASILSLAAATFYILLHDMNWGTGSLWSFVISLFTGFFSRLIV